MDKLEDYGKILNEISEKTSSIQTSVNYHNERLTKIEEAILQLAATNERVRSMTDAISEIKKANTVFVHDVWETFGKVREESVKTALDLAETGQYFASHDRRIDKLDEWKDTIVPDIHANSRIRGWVEKGIYVVATFIILGMVGSYFAFSGPSPVMTKLISIEHQLDKVTDIQKAVVELHKGEIEE